MSKLLEKLKKESARVKADSESRGSGGEYTKTDWFKPKVGDNMIRILPHPKKPDEELFFKRVFIHYISIKKKDGSMASSVPVRCLTDLDETCPLCAAYEKVLRKAGDDRDAKAKARNLKPTERYLYNIFDYEQKKIQPFAAPMTVHQGIMEYAEDFGEDMVSISKGRDWKIVKKEDKSKPKNLGISYSARPSMKESSFPEKLKPLLEGMVDLSTLYSDNAKKQMLAYLGVEETEDEEESGDVMEKAEEAERSATKAKKAAKKPEPEEDEEEEDRFAEEKPSKKVVSKTPMPEEDEEEEDDSDEEEEEKPAKKTKAKAKKSADVDVEDDDLDSELRELGVL